MLFDNQTLDDNIKEDTVIIFYSEKYNCINSRLYCVCKNYSTIENDNDDFWNFLHDTSKYPIIFIPQKKYLETKFTSDIEISFYQYNLMGKKNYSKKVTNFFDILTFTTLTNIFTVNELENFINENKYVVTYTGASWCPPCQKILRDLHIIENMFPTIKFVKIDFDFSKEIIKKYHGENKIPFFMFFKNNSYDVKGSIQNSDKNTLIDQIKIWTEDLVLEQSVFVSEDF